MKPRVRAFIWTSLNDGTQERRWHVEFEDSCGCREECDFPTFRTALRFAHHIANGGSRWEFTA